MGGVSASRSSNQATNSGSSQSQDFSQSSQNVWGAQSPYLQQLFGQAGNAAINQMGGIGDYAGQMAGDYQGQMQGITDQMRGGYQNPYAQQLASFNPAATGAYAGANNPFAQQQTQQLGQNLGQFFREQLNPAITGNATQVSQLGGSRQGIAQTGAADAVAQQFQQGATAIGNNAYNTGAQMSNAYDQMRMQGLMGGGQMMGQQNQLNMMGLGQAAQQFPNMFNMRMQPYQAAWMPLQNLAGILGGPTVLGQSIGFGQSQSQQQGQSSGSSSAVGMQVGM